MVKRRGRHVKLWQVVAIAIVIVGSVGVSFGTWAWYGSNKNHDSAERQLNADQIAATTKETKATEDRSTAPWRCSPTRSHRPSRVPRQPR